MIVSPIPQRILSSIVSANKYNIGLAAVVFYFSGWWYRNEYFYTFGIPRSSFTAADYTVFVHAFSVVWQIPHIVTDYKYFRLLVPSLAYTAWLLLGSSLVYGRPLPIRVRLQPQYLVFCFSAIVLFVVLHILRIADPPSDPILGRLRATFFRIPHLSITVGITYFTLLIFESLQDAFRRSTRFFTLKFASWALVFFGVFNVSVLAGQKDASRFFDGHDRTVVVMLSESFWEGVSKSPRRPFTDPFQRLQRDSKDGRVALVWKDQHETVFIWYGESTENSRVFRISNDHIVGTCYELGPDPPCNVENYSD